MLTETAFGEILLPPSSKISDYVVRVYRKYTDINGNNRAWRPG